MFGAAARHAARNDLAALGDEELEHLRVLVVDDGSAITAEGAAASAAWTLEGPTHRVHLVVGLVVATVETIQIVHASSSSSSPTSSMSSRSSSSSEASNREDARASRPSVCAYV